jgi:hypothetical protein
MGDNASMKFNHSSVTSAERGTPMKKILSTLVVMAGLLLAAQVQAAVIDLFETHMQGGGSVTDSRDASGLGTVKMVIGGAGSHYAALYADYEIDEAFNSAFNEYGSAGGALLPGQSAEIDEPGFNPFPGTDPPVFGDIYDNFLAKALDNSNGVPALAPFDVAMALGWNFTLAADEEAEVLFKASLGRPDHGFYLVQTDPNSQADIYFFSELSIRQGGGGLQVPEPSTIILLGSGLAGLFWYGRKRARR